MTKPIPDKAEVALEYPDKLYIGTFERTARFDAHLDENGISLSLYRTGEAVCVPKTSSVLNARPNRLNISGDDCAALLLPDLVRLTVQVKEPT